MSLNIPFNFPWGSTNRDLEQYIKNLSEKLQLNKSYNRIQYNSSLIQLAQNELQVRRSDKVNKFSKCTSIISLLAVFFSLLFSVIALSTSYKTLKSSDEWKDNQIEILRGIQVDINKHGADNYDNLNNIDEKLNVVVDSLKK